MSLVKTIAILFFGALAMGMLHPVYGQGKLTIKTGLTKSTDIKVMDSVVRKIPDSLSIEGKGKRNPQKPVKDSQSPKFSQRADKVDSLIGEVDDTKDFISSLQEFKSPQRIYSNKKVKAIFDSLGIGKLDTLLALASLKQELTEEGLMRRINSSFVPGASPEELTRSLSGLSSSKLQEEALSQLPPISGMQIDPKHLQSVREMISRRKMDSLIAAHQKSLRDIDLLDKIRAKYQDSLQVQNGRIDSILSAHKNSGVARMDSLNQKVLDSLAVYQNKFKTSMDSVNRLEAKADSIQVRYEKLIGDAEATVLKATDKIDSSKQLLMDKHKQFKLREKQIQDDLREVVLMQKPKFFDPFYFEGVASAFKRVGNMEEIHLSPGVGYELGKNFSIGVSPNLIIRMDGYDVGLSAGYRSFLKYRLFSQRAYFQAEDWVSPKSQDIGQHKILGGAGLLIPLTKKLAINVSLLYRVGAPDADVLQDSRWVFRVGISSIGERKFKRK